MSYDIDIIDTEDHSPCPTCGLAPRASETASFNVTYNIRPMLDHVGITFQDLSKLSGTALTARAAELVRRLEAPQHRGDLVSLNPSNGWGSLDILQQVARGILKACEEAGCPELYLS